jgi:hypothetical protein
MTDVVFVGKLYYGDRHPDQGLPPGGNGGEHPDQGLPPGWGGRPPHVGNRPPGSWDRPIDPGYGWGGGERPGNRPPGSWTPPVRPDQGLPGGNVGVSPPIYHPGHPDHGLPAHPDQGLPEPPPVPTHPWEPPAGEELPPPPEDIVNSYVAAVWNPTKQEWKVSVSDASTAVPK